MKLSAKKLTLTITAGLLLSALLLPSAFAASLPAGTVVSNGLIWTRNNSTVAPPGKSTWSVAKSTCDKLTAGGYSDWRLPVNAELNALKGALTSAGWTIDWNWSQTPGPGNEKNSGPYAKSLNANGAGNYLTIFNDSGDAYVSCVRSAP